MHWRWKSCVGPKCGVSINRTAAVGEERDLGGVLHMFSREGVGGLGVARRFNDTPAILMRAAARNQAHVVALLFEHDVDVKPRNENRDAAWQ
jgi:hypothetical protein